jgi:hypothetical protein
MTKLASTIAAAALVCGAAVLAQPADAATLNGAAGALRAASADVGVTTQVRYRHRYRRHYVRVVPRAYYYGQPAYYPAYYPRYSYSGYYGGPGYYPYYRTPGVYLAVPGVAIGFGPRWGWGW